MRCPECHGDGFVTDEPEPVVFVDRVCPTCRGTGFANGRLPADAPALARQRVAEIRRGQFR